MVGLLVLILVGGLFGVCIRLILLVMVCRVCYCGMLLCYISVFSVMWLDWNSVINLLDVSGLCC